MGAHSTARKTGAEERRDLPRGTRSQVAERGATRLCQWWRGGREAAGSIGAVRARLGAGMGLELIPLGGGGEGGWEGGRVGRREELSKA